MSRKTVSVDFNFEEIWQIMEEIEPLTPIIELQQYRCGKRSDDFMFRDADERLLYD